MAHTCCKTADNSQKRELQNSGRYKIKSHAATSNLTHYWLASKLMTTPRSSPISSLVPRCNPPKAQQLVLAESWLTGTNAALCQTSSHGNPKEYYQISHIASPSLFRDLPMRMVLGSPHCLTRALQEPFLVNAIAR